MISGDKLGPYEIVSLLGAGGMGEVYRARDPRVGRDVAIKVSQERFSERFDREVRVIASLNHPNICQLYDVGPNYLVMELVEGDSPCGPMSLDEALRIMRQIGDALDYAHEKGVVHRDLKPANVKIKPEGAVKVLDFGLAKQSRDSYSYGADSENSPTLSMAATRAGMILGTAAYMSPEQARGKSIDKRADVWSFGVVFYELLTGQKLFKGEDITETLASVVKERPDLSAVPPGVRRLLERCLEKDPKARLRDIGDAWALLDSVQADAAPSPSRLGIAGWIVAAVLGIAAIAAGWLAWRAMQPVERPLVRLDVDLGSDISLPPAANNFLSTFAISPDGSRIVYLASVGTGQPRLFTRRLDQTKASELPGTSGATGPFFSPDGQWVGFWAGGQFNKVSVEGGAVVPLAGAPASGGASWGQDGNIIASVLPSLVRIPSGGGPFKKTTDLANGELAQTHPQILPGGKAVLFVAYPTFDTARAHIDVVTLADGSRKTIMPGGTSPRYLPTSGKTGHLIFVNKGTLFAVPFDPDRLETHGTPVPILDDVLYQATSGGAQFDVSENGTLVYRKGSPGAASGSALTWVDATGKKDPLRSKTGVFAGTPHLSADGKRVAMALTEGSNTDVWVYEQQRDAMQRLTFGGVPYLNPAWSPDGKYVFIGSVGGLFWARSDGAGQPQALLPNKGFQIPWSVTADGKRLAYFEIAGAPQLWTVPLEEDNGQIKAGKPEQFLKSQFQDATPAFSPDGKWIAYQSNATGTNEIYVRPFPPPSSGQSGQWQISNSGGQGPMWTAHELLYQAGDQILAASYTVNGDSFRSEKPRVWLAKVDGQAFGLSPDGKRVAVMAPVETPEATKADHEVVFLQNFFDELRRRAPMTK